MSELSFKLFYFGVLSLDAFSLRDEFLAEGNRIKNVRVSNFLGVKVRKKLRCWDVEYFQNLGRIAFRISLQSRIHFHPRDGMRLR